MPRLEWLRLTFHGVPFDTSIPPPLVLTSETNERWDATEEASAHALFEALHATMQAHIAAYGPISMQAFRSALTGLILASPDPEDPSTNA